jgi:histidinol dehydrogenase
MKLYNYPPRGEWERLVQRPQMPLVDLDAIVGVVLKNIEKNGDAAVKEYTEKFDGVAHLDFVVSEKEINNAASLVSEELKSAIDIAARNIKTFHESQKTKTLVVETMPGVKCWQKPSPIEKVGLYIPGGTAPLFSTVLMLAIPAQIAGCREIILCSPPSKDGSLNPAILYAAFVTGVTRVFKIGGVQAIGAMAFGTESVPKVYKIFGPGNQYVTAAKQLVNRKGTAIDMPAGPSEVLVIADGSSNPAFVASDLLAQAEHGTDSHVVLLTTNESIIGPVFEQLELQLAQLTRKDIAALALEKSVAIIVGNEDEVIDLTNLYGPEHLIISTQNYNQLSERIVNAGSVFLGPYTPESAGDYASGTNHTLPTYGFAKAYNGVNLDSFVKKITYQEITKEGLQQLGPFIETMAQEELLMAHKNAVTLRLNEK